MKRKKAVLIGVVCAALVLLLFVGIAYYSYTSPYRWYNKGTALGELGKYEEAIECYGKALKIDPNHADAWCNKGNALDKLGKYEGAIECCDKALKINPNFAGAWYNKGWTLDELGRHKEAQECFERARELEK
jgi:tetratricopeptide (TPR) repeat protein